MGAFRRWSLVCAGLALLLGFALSRGTLRAFDCWMQPDGPDCACFDNTGAWNPVSAIIQDTAIPTVGTRESCNPPIDNGGKPYYQMVLGCTSVDCASAIEFMYTFGGVYPAREEWCTETVAFWHRQTGIPYAGGYRNAWWHSWQLYDQGIITDWYETEEALADGRGRWLDAEDLSYNPLALGVTLPVPGAYVAIRNYDSATNTWVSTTATTNSGKHSLMVNEMWIHRRPGGRVVRVDVSLLEGNSGEQVEDVGYWDNILTLTPQGSGTIGASKKIKGFGIDLNRTRRPVYDRARVHYVDAGPYAAAPVVTPVQPGDGEEQEHEEFMARLLAYATLARERGGPTVSSPEAPGLSRMPDGEWVKWVFPKGSQQDVHVLIDLLDVHPMPIAGIFLTWAPGFVPPMTRVEFSLDGQTYADAIVPNLANLSPPTGAPAIVPAAFTDTGDGVPVRYVRLTFPKGVFQQDATLREISFQYRRGPSDDAPEIHETRTVDIDILPQRCPNEWNVKTGGDLLVAVLGRPDLDVRRIQAASVRVMGVAPRSWKYGDIGAPVLSDQTPGSCACSSPSLDGVTDLVLRFDRARINAALGPIADEEVRTLTLKSDFGAYPSDHIEGHDCLIARVPGHPGCP